MELKPTTLGLIVGSRQFFPADLCEAGREDMLRALAEEGIRAVSLGPSDTQYGAVSTLDDALIAAEMLAAHAHELDGIVVTLPNFGDEKAVADTIRQSGLNVPILIHAYPDRRGRMDQARRRDSFCGKISLCNNLYQYGIKYTPTRLHTVDPDNASFREDLRSFAATCRVVKGLRKARIGALGARPAAFNTVRYSEKLLERNGVSVETLDLSEAFGRANALPSDDPAVQAKLASIAAYAKVSGVPEASLDRMARLGVVIDRWTAAKRLDATAIQCWTAMEEHFGTFPCTLMSMMSNSLVPAACETDVTGALGMYVLALASGQPAALVDWNNNFEDEADKAVIFHCSNLPAQVFTDIPVMTYNPGTAADFGQDNSYGLMYGRLKAEPFTYLRIATDDYQGRLRAYAGEGKLTADELDTYGGYGVAEIPHLQDLLQYIVRNGFEHHVGMTQALIGSSIREALGNYLGWSLYYHG
jgi:L-fucose isomerase-like protein